MRLSLTLTALLAACTTPPSEPPPPMLESGIQTLAIDGESRDVIVRLPETLDGAPMLFVFHFLGGAPGEMLAAFDIDRLVDDGWVVVAPWSRGLPQTEWEILSTPDGNGDVALFDELRTRAVATGVDPTAVFATGFSAGGLFTSYLTVHRSNELAAVAAMSGGVTPTAYQTPAAPIPVLLAWGGPDDNVFGFDFDGAARDFGDALVADGHPVWTCDHGAGHTVPASTADGVELFLSDQLAGSPGPIDGCVRR